MIQELLGGASLIGGGGGERKISILETPPSSTSSPSFSPSTTTSTTNTSSVTPANPSAPEHLRCPRCDSSNTKFCYYNNYNLTQPRHFCKTCRRYWTKGGALRNVPIGGGCRKNKNTTVSSSVGKSNGSNNKMRTMVSEIGRSGGFGSNGFDQHHEFASSPIFWASSTPQNSHLLNLLRATGHNPNPNPNPESNNSFGVKDEGCLVGNLNHLNMAAEPTSGGLNGRTGLGFDPLAHVPSLGLCSALWKNSQQNGVIVGEAQNSGIQELYQRLRSSSTTTNNNGNYYSENLNTPLVLNNVGSSSSSSNILESSPVAGSELGFWNPTFSWSDLPTTNGAYL